MSTVKADTILPSLTGHDITLGVSGDTVSVGGNDIRTNTVKDKGGNTIWTSDGTGTLSSVNSALQGSMMLLLSQTASGASSVSFTTQITSTYDVYYFTWVDISPTADDRLVFSCSTDGGGSYGVAQTTTSFRSIHAEADNDAGLSYRTAGDLANAGSYQWLTESIKNDADACGAGEMYLFAPLNTTFKKFYYAVGQILEASDYSQELFVSGHYNTTSAIDAIDFKTEAGNNFDGTITMYGLK